MLIGNELMVELTIRPGYGLVFVLGLNILKEKVVAFAKKFEQKQAKNTSFSSYTWK